MVALLVTTYRRPRLGRVAADDQVSAPYRALRINVAIDDIAGDRQHRSISGRFSMQNHRPWAFAISVGMALAIVVTTGQAKKPGTEDEHGYRTGTIVASDANECAGVPNCFSATLPPTTVPAKGRAEMRFACPVSHPNLWGWDAAQHEHIFVQMVDVDQFTVTVEGVNASDVPGDFIVSLGCSDTPYAGSYIQKSRQLAPTARFSKRKPAHTSRGRLTDTGNLMDTACDGVPDCQAQLQPTFAMGGWETTTKSYQCQKPYPYAWNMSYSQTGSPSVSAIGAIFGENPGTFDVLLTNWNLFATDDVTIVVACSKDNSFSGNSCGAPQSDPGCPQVPGSQHQYCSKGPVPVCFADYQERCQPSNVLYQCTIDVVIPWCQPCPGQ